ncbi:MAG: hypothetical protein JXR87_05950, partial [Candidatus Marinimicrobia bacterium]|nr:hypothetical protein [Candidatus Neomarinimicrobiota bacterium]
ATKVNFTGDARIEVGGPFIGAEFHHSYPAPQRISFFYPVANSIDISSDYWFRDTTLAMEIGLKIGDNDRKNISWTSTSFNLTPYNVEFNQENCQVSYQFCKNKPAMVVSIKLTNTCKQTDVYELDTRLINSLRTCHTFRWIQPVQTDYNSENGTAITRYNDDEISTIVVFVTNAAEKPTLLEPDSNVTTFLYRKELQPGDQMQIVQILGSCYSDEVSGMVDYLGKNYQDEIDQYEQYVNDKATNEYTFNTADSVFDQSVYWAKAMLASLDHYIDGEFVPMPCPAEYNFYFTHDVLVTDLAAVNFDLPRVKRDLKFILDHATEDFIIPHAYYWKDGDYRTEYADSNNWNHFWFIQVAASYLRHSGDKDMLETSYPYLTKSLEYALHSKEDDGLLYAYYLDGWDIGHNFGPRAFMTILAIKGIRDYVYISSVLNKNMDQLLEYELLAERMEQALIEKLWYDKTGFLVNYYENGEIDPHYYAGSLLSAHFGLLDDEKRTQLISTASEKLVDPKIGVYTVYPPDFHLLGDFLKFKGNEVGPPYHYANGGVWNHCNAWYCLGLMAIGQRSEAAEFIRRNMTLDGIINSPNGQPAMYEYRCSNKDDNDVYGKIDKPTFLWAAGWYLYSLYHLYGIEENVWNVSMNPFLPEGQGFCEFDLALNGIKNSISVRGTGNYFKSIQTNGDNCESAIFTENDEHSDYQISLGFPDFPYLESAESIVVSCDYDRSNRNLLINLRAFPGHQNIISIISPLKPMVIKFENQVVENYDLEFVEGIYKIRLNVIHKQAESVLRVSFIDNHKKE